jgi:UDP-sulfoquinovose synthase
VYGVETEEAKLATGLETRYDYDQIYGTALNRFCTQAAIDHPLIVHGRGGQTRGFLNIKDALRCIELAVLNPPSKGEYRVFNQFTEMFSVSDLAERVKAIAVNMGHDVHVQKIDNPRIEAEEHYYNAQNSLLKNLGLKPTLLNEEVIKNLISIAEKYKSNIEPEHIRPSVRWTQTSNLI